jgi:hypothetical protein
MLGCLAAGCGGSHGGAIASFTPSRSITAQASRTATLPSPTATLPTATASSPAAAAPTVSSTVTPALTAQPSSTASPASGAAVIWPWILLGALVIVGIVVLVSRASSRRSKTAASWRSSIIDAYAKGAALHDAMSVAELPGALAADDAGARWFDIQRRADELAQALYALREAASDEEDRALVADTLSALQVVRSAMDGERTPVGAGPEQAEVVRSRLSSFEASLRALRASSDPR